MTDFRALLSELRHQQMLIRAARYGNLDYRRDRDLKRLLNGSHPSPLQSVPRLLNEEKQMEAIRNAGDAAYSIARHNEVLITLMAEVRLLPRATMKA